MIERAVAAIDTLKDRNWNIQIALREDTEEIVRAVIEAMREPSAEMLAEATAYDGYTDLAQEQARGTWQDMIDAALK